MTIRISFLVCVFLWTLQLCVASDEEPITSDEHLYDDDFELIDDDYLELADNSSDANSVRRIPIFGKRRRMMTTTTSTVEPPRAHTYSPEFLASANDYNISNRVLDIFYFSRYCGPGERVWGGRNTVAAASANAKRISYADLDECCRHHDECPNYIRDPEHYSFFPGLEYRNQYFSRLQCDCDGLFYRCLDNLNSRYGSAIAIGYGIVQSYCFQFEHPIVRCAKRSLRRCEEYVVDELRPKQWQWFDVPPAYKKIYEFPQIIKGP